jgi:hypothetical protein
VASTVLRVSYEVRFQGRGQLRERRRLALHPAQPAQLGEEEAFITKEQVPRRSSGNWP